MNYYVCDKETGRVCLGPMTNDEVVEWIDAQPYPLFFCNYSEHLLVKNGIYEKGKAGKEAIRADLQDYEHPRYGVKVKISGLCVDWTNVPNFRFSFPRTAVNWINNRPGFERNCLEFKIYRIFPQGEK